jgi:hypothetical protein
LSPESGQDHDVNTSDRAFEDMAKFMVLGIAEHIKISFIMKLGGDEIWVMVAAIQFRSFFNLLTLVQSPCCLYVCELLND